MPEFVKKFAYILVTGFLRNQTKRLIRQNPDLKIVAITGSVGKTTSKVAIATVLSQKFKVLAHPGSYNTKIGIPLSLFELESPGSVTRPMAWLKIWWQIEKKLRRPYRFQVAVLEMGADAVGGISTFMRFIKPDIGVVTAVKPAHLEGFKSLKNIQNEKFKLAEGSQQVLINAEDSRLMAKVGQTRAKNILLFGLKKGDFRYDVTAFQPNEGFEGVMHLKNDSFPVHLNLFGKHNLYAAVAAAAAGHLLGMSKTQIRAGLKNIVPVAGRMNPLPGIKQSLIIDDSYNANPEAVKAALDTLYGLKGRKVAVLGMMNEMGKFSSRFHKEVGRYAKNVDLLITVGDHAQKYLAPAAIAAGLAKKKVISFDSPYAAGRWLKDRIQAQDNILVKGSQGNVFLEEAVAIILADKKDRAKLVRQYPFWQDIKQQAFADARD